MKSLIVLALLLAGCGPVTMELLDASITVENTTVTSEALIETSAYLPSPTYEATVWFGNEIYDGAWYEGICVQNFDLTLRCTTIEETKVSLVPGAKAQYVLDIPYEDTTYSFSTYVLPSFED